LTRHNEHAEKGTRVITLSVLGRWPELMWSGTSALTTAEPPVHENRLLASLPRDDQLLMAADFDPIRLDLGRVVAALGEPVRHVYFLRDAVLTLLVEMEDGTSVEGATIGNEGMVGLDAFLGARAATAPIVVQIAGQAVRMEAEAFHEAVRRSSALQLLLNRYTVALMNQLARTAACNRLHSVRQRCARWLLMSADRVGRDIFPLTHESLATVLGVRRASISEAAEAFRNAALIDYQRGHMAILDRAGLARAACEDYALSRDGYDQIYGHAWP
jgi:CRP-like cAMP-binding protein